jgi:uncharacterized protein DUF6049
VTQGARDRLPAPLPAVVATLVAVLTVLAGSLSPARADAVATRADQEPPLAVSIATLAPATIPQHGRVTVTGRITNRSRETWTDLKVYLWTYATPIRSRSELADAAANEPEVPIGSRQTSPGLYENVGDLAPGESVGYRLSVPRQDLGISGEPGVYWVGVHVLGADRLGRDLVADGRARTFMPLLPAGRTHSPQTPVALLLPLQERVRRGAHGRLVDPRAWHRLLGTEGRLTRLLRMSTRAHVPLTWVVDPALLDAVQSVSQGNPPFDPPPDPGADVPSGSPSASPSATTSGSSSASTPSASSSSSTSASPGGGGQTNGSRSGGDAGAARAWLAQFRRLAPALTVATVPYGDLDVASVLTSRRRGLYAQAAALSRSSMSRYGIQQAVPVVDPPSGYLPAHALHRIAATTPVVLSDAALPRADAPVVVRDGRAPVVLTDTAAGGGGPGPSPRYSALAVRQRVLSAAALHAMSADRDQPLVVSTPTHWNPGSGWSTAAFFAGLDQPWLRLVDLPSVVSGGSGRLAGAPPGETSDPGPIEYPSSARSAELPSANLAATELLGRAGEVFARLLGHGSSDKSNVDDAVSRVAMLASSTTARTDAVARRALAENALAHVRAQLGRVRVEGPPFVMMSGESGPIQVTLVNDLPQSVTVGLRTSTRGSRLHIDHFDPVTLGPDRRMSIRLQAHSTDIGVHAVTLQATDATGVPLGSSAQFSVRTSHVSTVIWLVMAAGGIVLLIAIVVRVVRRVRRRKATHGPLLPRDAAPQPEQELRR